MPENHNIEFHSNEIQDIMSKIPGWIIRWGLIVIAIIFLGIAVACYFIKYPQIVITQLQFTSYNPPVELIAKTSNKIARLFVSNGDTVTANTDIMLLRNSASYEDVKILEQDLLLPNKEWEELVYDVRIYRNYKLGDIQNDFLQYQKRCAVFKSYLETSLLMKKRKLLEVQICKQEELLKYQKEQLQLLIDEFNLTLKNHERDSIMLSIGGLSKVDFERSIQSILQKKSSILGFKSNITSTETSILSLKENLIEIDIQSRSEFQNYYLELNELKQQLKLQIERWKELYLVTSPITGEISISKFWSENQNVIAEDKVATIIPFEGRYIIGKAFVPHSEYAKVEEGQKVNVKLASYPYMEFGFIVGTVKSISPIPEQSGYAVEVLFQNELVSSYGKKLNFIHQMTGTAEIVTKDARLIEQFIQPLRAVLDNLKK